MTELAADTFDTANGPPSANWATITGFGFWTIVSNEAETTSGSGTCGNRYSGALVGGGAWPNDQYAEAIVGTAVTTVTDEGMGPAVRWSSSAATGYFAQTNTVETRLYKVVAGAFTQLGSDGAACAAGNTLRIEITGSSIVVKKNGSTIINATDSAIASGSAGTWGSSSGANPASSLASWSGGDFLGGAALTLMGQAIF